MSNVYPLLPKLTVHRQFIDDFLAARAPCFALGMIEERKQKLGLLALRPDKIIPPEITAPGFNFGHSLLGNAHYEVVHFAFEFYGFDTYNVLINPNNPLAQAVLDNMIESGEYFFLAIGPNQSVTAFRSEIGKETLAGITDNLARIKRSITSDAQYQQALSQFQKRPLPPGQLLSWVCRDNLGYLDIASDPLEMTPAADRDGTISAGDNTSRVSQRRALAELLDGKVNELIRAGITDDFTLLSHMASDMPLFKRLMDISNGDGMNDLCAVHPGLYRFAKLLERIAAGIQSGEIEVPR
ncbi:hypothetical protein [Methylomonas lenta]|uniref:hypothetical protein n=1 Tax=Methylomonas lenta TaxID=980561 RepID=UPI000832822C|nr:hypothetical protein [Methylomonas lenta]